MPAQDAPPAGRYFGVSGDGGGDGCQCDRVGGARQVFARLHQLRPFPRLVRIWVDGGYREKTYAGG